MNTYYLLGLFVGLFVGFLLIFSALKFTRTDRKRKLKYDERQIAAQGKAYKYGFFATLFANVLYGIAESSTNYLLMDPMAAMTICICIGVFVYAANGIWNDAYFALNERPKSIVIIFLAITVINLLPAINNIRHGKMIVNGTLQSSCCNLACGLLILAVLLVIAVKHMMMKREEDEML
ncbi:MAG: hypothetical protein Q4E53_01755 [Eubacteriales bacterium]|nr:hypothetical protein [Eubacteriales bacterium]